MNKYKNTDYNLDRIRIKEIEKSIIYIKKTKKDMQYLVEYQEELKELKTNTKEYQKNNYFYNY